MLDLGRTISNIDLTWVFFFGQGRSDQDERRVHQEPPDGWPHQCRPTAIRNSPEHREAPVWSSEIWGWLSFTAPQRGEVFFKMNSECDRDHSFRPFRHFHCKLPTAQGFLLVKGYHLTWPSCEPCNWGGSQILFAHLLMRKSQCLIKLQLFLQPSSFRSLQLLPVLSQVNSGRSSSPQRTLNRSFNTPILKYWKLISNFARI